MGYGGEQLRVSKDESVTQTKGAGIGYFGYKHGMPRSQGQSATGDASSTAGLVAATTLYSHRYGVGLQRDEDQQQREQEQSAHVHSPCPSILACPELPPGVSRF